MRIQFAMVATKGSEERLGLERIEFVVHSKVRETCTILGFVMVPLLASVIILSLESSS